MEWVNGKSARSSSSYLFSDNNMTQYHKNSHTIGGLPEKPYSSLTGRPSKKINCPQIILSHNKQNTNKKQHCAGATGHKADPDAFKRFIISGAIYHLIVWSPSLIEDNEAVEWKASSESLVKDCLNCIIIIMLSWTVQKGSNYKVLN